MTHHSLWVPLRICLILLGLGLILCIGFFSVNVKVFDFQQSLADQSRNYLVGRVYLPGSGQAPFPTVILCHGVSSHKNTMTPLAVELAKQGIAAVTFDFGGYGQSYSRPLGQAENLTDVQSILRWVKGNLSLDADRLGIAGHSMGGTTALETALNNDQFKATVLLGIGGTATPSSPRNLMFGVGIYEQLNPIPEMRVLFNSSVDKLNNSGTVVSRSLVISPTADHAIDPYDPFLITKTVEWFQRSFALPNEPVRVTYQYHLVGLLLCGISILGLNILLLQVLQSRCHYLLPLSAISSSIVISFFGRWPIAGLLAIGMTPALLTANYLQRYQKSLVDVVRRISFYGLIVYLAYSIGLVSHAVFVASLVELPLVMRLPELLAYMPFASVYNQFYGLLYTFNNSGILSVSHILGVLLIAAEVYRQGLVCNQLDRVMSNLIQFIRKPIELKLELPRSSKLMIVVVMGLLVILMIVLKQQWEAGLLTGDAFVLVGRLIGFFVLLPTSAVVLLLRWSRFKQIEERLFEPRSTPK